MKYNLTITKPISIDVKRVIKYFNQTEARTLELIREYSIDDYEVSIKSI